MTNQHTTSGPAVPSTKVSARDLVSEAARVQRNEQINQAANLFDTLDQIEDQIAEFERAEANLKQRNLSLPQTRVEQLAGLRAQAEEIRRQLALQGEDTARIAQFRIARRQMASLANSENAPSLPAYADAVHALLDVCDHAVVTSEELAEARKKRAMGQFVFCDCRACREHTYAITRADGTETSFRGSYFRFDSYGKSPAIRGTVFFALKTRDRIRNAERAARDELAELLKETADATAEDILDMRTEGLLAVPVLFRDGNPGGKLVLEVNGEKMTVTLRAATHRGMANILKDCIGQSLTAENRRDGTGLFFKGPSLLFSVINRSAVEPASDDKLRELQERFSPHPASPMDKPEVSGSSDGKPERERKPRSRKPRHEPSAEEELAAEAEIAAEASSSQQDETSNNSAPRTWSVGPDEEPESPFAVLAQNDEAAATSQ